MLKKEAIEKTIQEELLQNKIDQFKVTIYNENPKRVEICIASNEFEIDLNKTDEISKLISPLLDTIDHDQESYLLDICSFGAEKELNDEQERIDSIGSYIHVDLYNQINGLSSIEGTLTKYDQQAVIEHFVKGVKKTTAVERENIKFMRMAVKF